MGFVAGFWRVGAASVVGVLGGVGVWLGEEEAAADDGAGAAGSSVRSARGTRVVKWA